MKIVVATDFSDLAARAADEALRLARATQGQLELVHVVEAVDDVDSDDPEIRAFHEELKQKSQQKLSAEEERLGLASGSSRVTVGIRHLAIVELANEAGAELLVLGSRPLVDASSRPGVSHKVALCATLPTMLVP
ncbi:MAG: universal stress protein [Vulcanimicrobiota bacterium]